MILAIQVISVIIFVISIIVITYLLPNKYTPFSLKSYLTNLRNLVCSLTWLIICSVGLASILEWIH